MDTSAVITTIRQLVSRLEDATSSERLDALDELKKLARSNPKETGEIALTRVLKFLQEQGSKEEYEESLELISRLVKTRDKEAASSNASIILSDVSFVELLIDLMEHEDFVVGVEASQILSELHLSDGKSLERQIQECPAGMTKLLQRLPDRSREEVSNQAIVFVQQLTATNEEMKKTVAFNEGFEMLFGIIRSEGGAKDAGLVVEDCLKICNNILFSSDPCQRLFFGMGPEWALKLSDFFDPVLLENLPASNEFDDDESSAVEQTMWYDIPNRARCAYLCLDALAGSLDVPNQKHQSLIGITLSSIVPAATAWIGRRGPTYLIKAALSLLSRVADKNPSVASKLLDMTIKLSPSQKGKNIPSEADVSGLTFGWRPLPSDDRRCISVASLLAERYVYPQTPWCGKVSAASDLRTSGDLAGGPDRPAEVDTMSAEVFGSSCLNVLETIFAGDAMATGMLIQYILAPPPPMPDDDDQGFPQGVPLETMRPLGAIVTSNVAEVCAKIMDGSAMNLQGSNAVFRSEVETAERCANVLALIFLNGGQLARELSTAISTLHIAGARGAGALGLKQQPMLPFLLASAGRAARLPGCHGFVVALLRGLAVVASECDRATRQMLEDPSNLFVIDLSTSTSEAAGVPQPVQVLCCLFLGSCFLSLQDANPPSGGGSNGASDSEDRLTKQSLLGMIDSRIGLTRFTEILKRPIASPRGGNLATSQALAKLLFVTPGYAAFYEKQVESIRNGIFDMYSGGASDGVDKDSPQQQVIEIQKEKIAELQDQLNKATEALAAAERSSAQTLLPDPAKIKSLQTALQEKTEQFEQLTQQHADALKDMDLLREESALLRERLDGSLQSGSGTSAENSAALAAMQQRADAAEAEVAKLTAAIAVAAQKSGGGNDLSSSSSAALQDEVLKLKEALVEASAETKIFKEIIEQRDRKIEILEDEMRGPMPFEKSRDKMIADLESRNGELRQQVWQLEADVKAAQTEQANVSEAGWAVVARALQEYVQRVGATVDSDSIEKLFDRNLSLTERAAEADAVVTMCADSVAMVAGTCSDIVEALQLGQLEGEEGTLKRVLDCAETLSNCVKDIDEDRVALTADIARLTADLEAKTAEFEVLDQLDSANLDLKATVARLEEDLARKAAASSLTQSEELQAVSNRLQDVNDFNVSLEAANGFLKTEIDSLSTQLATITKQLEAESNAREQLEAQYQTALTDGERMKSELELALEASRVAASGAEEELGALATRLREADDLTASLGATNSSLKSEMELISAQLATATNQLEAELSGRSQLEAQYQVATADAERLRSQLQGALEGSEGASAAHKAELDAISTQLRGAIESIAALQSTNGALQAQVESISAQLATATKQLEAESVNRAQQEAQYQVAVKEADLRAAELEGTVARLQDELAEKAEESGTLNLSIGSQLGELELQRSQLLERIAGLEKELARAKDKTAKEVAKVDAIVMDAQQQEQVLQDRIKSLESELLSAKEATETASQQLESERQAHSIALEGERASAAATIAEVRTFASQSSQQVDELQGQLRDSILALEEKERLYKQLSSNAKEELVAQFTRQIETAKVEGEQRAQSLLSDVARLREENETLIAQAAQAAAALTDANKAKEALSTDADKAKEALSAFKAQYTNLSREIGSAKAVEATLRKELADRQGAIAALEADKNCAQQAAVAELEAQKALAATLAAEQQELLEVKAAELAAAGDEASRLREKAASLEAEISRLAGQLEASQLELSELKISMSTELRSNALHAQQEELKRVSAENATLSADLMRKEAELQELTGSSKRREGELAGIRSTIQGMEEEIESLREQKHKLDMQAIADGRAVKEAQRELDRVKRAAQLDQEEMARLRHRLTGEMDLPAESKHDNGSTEDGRLASHALGSIRGLLQWVSHFAADVDDAEQVVFVAIDDSAADTASEEDVDQAVEKLRSVLEVLLRQHTQRVEGFEQQVRQSELQIQQYEADLAAARAAAATAAAAAAKPPKAAVPVASNTQTPAKTAKSSRIGISSNGGIHALRGSNGSAADGDDPSHSSPQRQQQQLVPHWSADLVASPLVASPLVTPGGPGTGGVGSALMNRSLTSSIVAGSPSAALQVKEVAKLHAEIMRERRRLHTLQEEHTDLLGLLAQQELELGAFRSILETEAGPSAVRLAEEQAQQQATEKYGSYTQFRQGLITAADASGEYQLGDIASP